MERCEGLLYWQSIWLVECSPSLRSDCMVLPYLKGLINKEKHFHVILLDQSCYFWVYFYYHIFAGQIYYK